MTRRLDSARHHHDTGGFTEFVAGTPLLGLCLEIVLPFTVDQTIAAEMGAIFVCLGRQSEPFYPEDYETEIEAVIEAWRPEIWAERRK